MCVKKLVIKIQKICVKKFKKICVKKLALNYKKYVGKNISVKKDFS